MTPGEETRRSADDTISKTNLLDVHSHILPGLDDGVKTLTQSIEVLVGLQQLGFTDVVATPHFYPGKYTPSFESIQTALAAVKDVLVKQRVPVNLLCGRECFFDYELTIHPERDTFSFEWNGKRFQLIELPSHVTDEAIHSYLKILRASTIYPVLAHAERYNSVIRNPDLARKYADMGFRIQLDIASFCENSHPHLRRTAISLMESKVVGLLASDIHRPSQLKLVEEGLMFVRKRFGEHAVQKLFTLE